jgi:prepilin-type N-terminal cleavage/methylation domain-containing protein
MNKEAFTLIELLVVVLIIGILAAIALPQYNKAVARSRAVQLKIILKNVADAQQLYLLKESRYADKFSDLDIELNSPRKPATSSLGISVPSTDAVRQYDNFEVLIAKSTNYFAIAAFNTSGPYKGSSMQNYISTNITGIPSNVILCAEDTRTTVFTKPAGDYCTKILGYEHVVTANGVRFYREK